MEALTTHHEAAFPEPWAVSDAPEDFTEKLIGQWLALKWLLPTIRQVENKSKSAATKSKQCHTRAECQRTSRSDDNGSVSQNWN